MHKTNETVFLYILLGVAAFGIGTYIAYSLKDFSFVTEGYYRSKNYSLRYTLLYVIAVLCILYYMPSFLHSILSMLQGVSLNDVRGTIQDGVYSTGLANLVPNYIILPLSITLEPLAALDIWLGKRDKKLIALVIILIIIRTLGDGGRTPVFNFVLYFIVAYLFRKKKVGEDPLFKRNRIQLLKEYKERMRFRIVLLFGIFGLAVLTFMRASRTFYRKLYFYFAMSPVLFSRWQEYVDAEGIRTHGVVSINGVFYFIDYLIKNIFGLEYTEAILDAYKLVALTDAQWMQIAPTTTANAYVSCFWFFYVDGGIIAIIVLSLLYGLLVGRFYYKAARVDNLKTLALYMLLFQGIFFSFIRFPFAKAYYVIAIFVLYAFAFKPVKQE